MVLDYDEPQRVAAMGVQAGGKLRSCIVWVLGALLGIASLDTIPDPPALHPHSTALAASQSSMAPCPIEQRLRCAWSCPATQSAQVRWITFTSLSEPRLPKNEIALAGHAADPSPPMLQVSGRLLLQS